MLLDRSSQRRFLRGFVRVQVEREVAELFDCGNLERVHSIVVSYRWAGMALARWSAMAAHPRQCSFVTVTKG